MEAEYGAAQRRRRLVVLAGMVLAIVAAAAVYYLVTRPSTGGQEAPTRSVVVAAVDIPERTVIDATMLRQEEIPDSPALRRVLGDPSVAIGSVTVVAISMGDLITPSLYASGTAGGMSILSPGETIAPDSPIWRAVSVSVPADRAVARLIDVGDRVDLIVTLLPQLFDPNGGVPASFPASIPDPDHVGPLTFGYYSEASTKLTWTNLEILSVQPEEDLYVLRVQEFQAEEIAHVQAIEAKFAISLRPAPDTREVDLTDFGQTTNTMINSYGYPIPNMIEVPAEVPSPGP